MPYADAITIMTRCGLECLAARSGHGRRWARARCTAALVSSGTPEPLAANCAAAMAAVGQHLYHVIEQAVAVQAATTATTATNGPA